MGHVDDDVQIDRNILAEVDGGIDNVLSLCWALPELGRATVRRRIAAMERQGLIEVRGRGRITRAAMKAPEVDL